MGVTGIFFLVCFSAFAVTLALNPSSCGMKRSRRKVDDFSAGEAIHTTTYPPLPSPFTSLVSLICVVELSVSLGFGRSSAAVICWHFVVSCPAISLPGHSAWLVCVRVLSSMYQPLPTLLAGRGICVVRRINSFSPTNSPASPRAMLLLDAWFWFRSSVCVCVCVYAVPISTPESLVCYMLNGRQGKGRADVLFSYCWLMLLLVSLMKLLC